MNVIQKGPGLKYAQCIYIFSYKGSSKLLRIGVSGNVHTRFNQWERRCGPIYSYDPELYDGSEMRVHFAHYVETLIHTELSDSRLRVNCVKCGVMHMELFYVSKDHAMRVIQKWRHWMLQEPYMRLNDNRWVFKPSFRAQAAEMCQPLAMGN